MRITVLVITVLVTYASAAKLKRQVQYQSGAARSYDNYQPQAQQAQQQPQPQAQSFRPQVAAAPQQSYDPSAYQQQAQPAPRRQSVQNFGGSLSRSQQQGQQQDRQQQPQSEEEEEENKPNPLTLLLEKSTFSCSGKTDGYFADNSVACQVFHYCVAGAKHSWMCPEGTVFHQVHLNCVPSSQDICQTAEKFYFVNDYLHKELDAKGPNNTVLYAQRYYPDGYVLGDPFTAPSGQQQPQAPQQYQPEPQQQQRPRQQAPQQSFRAPAAPRGPPQQFQQPPQYSAPAQPQQQAPAQFGGAQPSRGSSGGFGFPPNRVYTIPAPNRQQPDATPAYLYRQSGATTAPQQSSVKYDDDY